MSFATRQGRRRALCLFGGGRHAQMYTPTRCLLNSSKPRHRRTYRTYNSTMSSCLNSSGSRCRAGAAGGCWGSLALCFLLLLTCVVSVLRSSSLSLERAFFVLPPSTRLAAAPAHACGWRSGRGKRHRSIR